MNIRIKYCAITLTLSLLAALISFQLYAASQSDCQNLKASESTMTSTCTGLSDAPKSNGDICEYDSTPGCAGSQDSNNGTSVQVYKGDGAVDNYYVNCMDRHYIGYCSYGQCVGVVYTNSGFVTRHVVYTTMKCR